MFLVLYFLTPFYFQVEPKQRQFTLIAFGDEPLAWSDHLVTGSPISCSSAVHWLQDQVTLGSRNTLAALQFCSILATDRLQEIFIISNGYPHQPVTKIEEFAKHLFDTNRISISTVSFNCREKDANRHLHALARATNGTFQYYFPVRHTPDVLTPEILSDTIGPPPRGITGISQAIRWEILAAVNALHKAKQLFHECQSFTSGMSDEEMLTILKAGQIFANSSKEYTSFAYPVHQSSPINSIRSFEKTGGKGDGMMHQKRNPPLQDLQFLQNGTQPGLLKNERTKQCQDEITSSTTPRNNLRDTDYQFNVVRNGIHESSTRLYDSSHRLPSDSSYIDESSESRIRAHDNILFDPESPDGQPETDHQCDGVGKYDDDDTDSMKSQTTVTTQYDGPLMNCGHVGDLYCSPNVHEANGLGATRWKRESSEQGNESHEENGRRNSSKRSSSSEQGPLSTQSDLRHQLLAVSSIRSFFLSTHINFI